MIGEIVPVEERCRFCKNKRATKLCDFPSGKWVSPHMVKKHGKTITCDRPMCDDCAIEVSHDTDFCPECMKVIESKKRGGRQ
jgi:hypothetical protein